MSHGRPSPKRVSGRRVADMTDDDYRGPGRLGTGMRHIVWRLETAISLDWPIIIRRTRDARWHVIIHTPGHGSIAVDADTFDGAVKLAYSEIEP